MGRECVEVEARGGEGATQEIKSKNVADGRKTRTYRGELEDRKSVRRGMYRVKWSVLSEVTTAHDLKAFHSRLPKVLNLMKRWDPCHN